VVLSRSTAGKEVAESNTEGNGIIEECGNTSPNCAGNGRRNRMYAIRYKDDRVLGFPDDSTQKMIRAFASKEEAEKVVEQMSKGEIAFYVCEIKFGNSARG
jgi:hypothetical protein